MDNFWHLVLVPEWVLALERPLYNDYNSHFITFTSVKTVFITVWKQLQCLTSFLYWVHTMCTFGLFNSIYYFTFHFLSCVSVSDLK